MREERPPERTEEADGQNPSEVFVGITSQFFVDQILPLIPSEQNIGLISNWELKTQATKLDSTEAIRIGIDPIMKRDYFEDRETNNLVLRLHSSGSKRSEELTLDNDPPNLLHAYRKLRPNFVTFNGHSDTGFSILKKHIGTIINPSRSDFLERVNIDFSQSKYKLIYLHDQGKVLLFKSNSTLDSFYGHEQELKSVFDKIKKTLETESVDLKVEKAVGLSLINSQLYNASYVTGALSLLVLQNPGLLAKVTAGISALYSGIVLANTQGIDNTIIELNKKIRNQRQVLIKE